jgi:hypothetical protein
MICTLLGHDPAPAQGGEDAVDDVIPNGTLTPVGGQTIRADGLDLQHFDLNTTVALADLNEDSLSRDNPDEIKAQVQLTPIASFGRPVRAGRPNEAVEPAVEVLAATGVSPHGGGDIDRRCRRRDRSPRWTCIHPARVPPGLTERNGRDRHGGTRNLSCRRQASSAEG